MAISRAQLVKELEPGLNALFGLEYKNYENQHTQIYSIESSDRAFEEEVMESGFGEAPVKTEGSGVAYDQAQEVYTARYTHETIALAFSLTEEAVEDNLYDRLGARYTRALARSMAQTKQIKAAAILNGAFTTSIGGDGVALCSTAHPTLGGPNLSNTLATPADLSETSLEQSLIDISAFTDERGLKIAVQGLKLIIPKELVIEVVLYGFFSQGESQSNGLMGVTRCVNLLRLVVRDARAFSLHRSFTKTRFHHFLFKRAV
jgi:hypothetical protein